MEIKRNRSCELNTFGFTVSVITFIDNYFGHIVSEKRKNEKKNKKNKNKDILNFYNFFLN